MKRTAILTLIAIHFCFFTSLSQDRRKDKKKDDNKVERLANTNTNFTSSIKVIPVKDSIYMLQGKGGNIGLCVGKEGAFLIDSQFSNATPDILHTVSSLTLKPVQFLVNTHHHGDHTGGNQNMTEAGVTIFAHDNVRQRLLQEIFRKKQDSLNKAYEATVRQLTESGVGTDKAQERAKNTLREVPVAADGEGLIYPMVTFSQDMTFYYNGEKIFVFHVHNAHTDGDIMIYFTKSNVLHTGDAYINGRYPFIDVSNGGSLDGYKEALAKIQMVANDDTIIIPGHGGLASLKDVKYTASMIEFLSQRIAFHRVGNKTLEEVLAMNELTKEFDDKGFGDGSISRDQFVTVLYQDAARKYDRKDSKNKQKSDKEQ